MRAINTIIWSGISIFGQSGIAFLSTIILARMLTPDDFGLIGIVTLFIAFSQMMVDSEMGGALLKKKTVDNTDYSTLFYYNLAASLVLYVILYASAPLIADFYDRQELTDIIRIISFTIIIHAFRVVQRIMIFRSLNFKAYALINMASGIISLAAALWIAKAGYGYWALVWQQIVLAFANVVFLQLYNRFIPSLCFSKESFRYQFSFGISLLGADTVKTIANNISTNIIGKISSLEFTGCYSQASRVSGFCQTFLTGLMDQTIFPMMVKIDDMTRLKSIYHKTLIYMTLSLSVVTVLFVTLATPIIHYLLGEEWIQASGIFQILSLTILPASVQVLCRNIIKTLGDTKRVLYLETIKSSILISFLLAASLAGNYYVVWSLAVSQTVCCFIWLYETEARLNIRIRMQADTLINR
ncbi:MAG: lipopolysaccharide biosynthesis protein [Muribaculaceae bacterium]|nr:lipopolysaccharide biosynthesis protein [Muribaculaceae bacterium]